MGIVKRQSVQSSIATYVGVMIGYINLILLFPKFLTPEQFGLTRVLLSVSVILTQFSMLGLNISLLRFFPYVRDRKTGHHGFLTFALLFSLVGFIFFSLVFLIFKNNLLAFFAEKSPLFVEYYWYVLPITLFLTVFEIFFIYLRSLYKTVLPAFIKEILLRLLQTAALLLLLSGLIDFRGFLLLFTATYLLHLLVIISYAIYLKQFFIFSRIDFNHLISMRKVIRYSLFIFAAAISYIYTTNIDQIMLGAMAGLASNAVYSIAFFTGTMIQIPGRAMNQVALPIIADAWKRDDKVKLQELYTQTSLNQFIIGGFIFLLIWINVDLLLSLLPPDYEAAKWVILIVGLGKLFDMATGINGEILIFSKHVKVMLVTNLFLIIIATVSNYLLIPIWGVTGSAVATGVSIFFFNFIRMSFLYYKYRLQPFNVNTLKSLLLLVCAFFLYYLLPHLSNPWLTGIYQSVLVTLLVAGSLLILKISPEITASYQWAKSRLFSTRSS